MIQFTQYTEELTDLLAATIVARDHVITGNLRDSVEFRFDQDELKIKLVLDSLHYIVYLEDGEFLNYFFSLPQVEDIVDKMIFDYIEYELKQLDEL